MSDENQIEKVLSRADKLKFLGRNRAFIALLFAVWAAKKKGGFWSARTKLGLLVGGASGFGYWHGFFS
jgi:hypothetical protein